MSERPDVKLDDLYREVVMDHHRHPRGRTPLAKVDARAHGFNPVCGDEVLLSMTLEDGHITGVEIAGHGCAICTASGSMMAEIVPGRTIEHAVSTAEGFRGVMHGLPAPADLDMGDLEALEGVQRFPVRVKCAMLPWVTLLDAVKSWRAGRPCSRTSTEAE